MNSFGKIFRISIFGESHSDSIGVTLDGVPPGIEINPNEFIEELKKRAPGKPGTTQRIEEDTPLFLSGIYNGFSTGDPLTIIIKNRAHKPQDYQHLKDFYRPGHADFTSEKKSKGFAPKSGGGHHSGRVTAALVIAGVIAKKVISQIEISCKIIEVGGNNPWERALEEAINSKDSLGGIIECTILNSPIGLGEPFFDSVESSISHIIFAIPGVWGIEFGDGFKSAKLKGSEHNDPILNKTGKTSKNGAGGINGGISNGNPIFFKVAIKPTSSIGKTQYTYDKNRDSIQPLEIEGRHDVCFALRVPPIIEAATAIAMADLYLINKTR